MTLLSRFAISNFNINIFERRNRQNW